MNGENRSTRNIDKYFEMAKKPERLTTEDDLKILNSFMSSDKDKHEGMSRSNEVNLDSCETGIQMKIIGVGSI